MIPLSAIVLFSLLALTGTGSDSTTNTYSHPGKYAIINGDIMLGNGIKIDSGILLIEDGSIAFIGKNVRILDIYEVIDATGKTVYPGFDQWEPYMEFSSSDRLTIPADRLPVMIEMNKPLAVGVTANLFIAESCPDSSRITVMTIFIEGSLLSKEQMVRQE